MAAAMAMVILIACAAPTAAPTRTPLPTVPSPTPTPSPTPSPTPMALANESLVTVGTARFVVEVADTAEKRGQGLSGRPNLAPGTGMLFVFDREDRFFFWMREMQFPLDFVWISADCTAADLTENVPPPEPDTSPADLSRYQPEVPVRYVLEINAGVIAAEGINPGDLVSFDGSLAGKYGC